MKKIKAFVKKEIATAQDAMEGFSFSGGYSDDYETDSVEYWAGRRDALRDLQEKLK